MKPKPKRSTLSKSDARKRYIEMAELVVLEQIRQDSVTLEENAIAIGPFARLDAGMVAAQDGKTRGAITNLFGSQAAFQTETMALALSAANWIEEITYPDPADFDSADAWVDAFFSGQSERGPRHGAIPRIGYEFLWVLWLSTIPYGLWSGQVARSGMEEHVQWVSRLEQLFSKVIDHFGLALRDDVRASDLASAAASMVEGVWLNQCLTPDHPTDPNQPISTALRRAGQMLWRGSIQGPDK